MPTYDYICDACGHEFEVYESITADPRKDCPQCQRDQLRRKIGPGAAILFKGSGFYQTDYRSDSYKKGAAADKPAESKPAESKTSDSGSGPNPRGESAKPSSTPSSSSATNGSGS